MPEGEESFTVRDRRRFNTEETAPESANSTPAETAPVAESTESDASGLEGFPEADHELPDIYSVLALFLGELRNLAWLRMGLVANPGTGKIERDLSQAKIAIDTVAFLATQIEPAVPAEEKLPLRALVSDLQINFVEQSKK